MRHSRQTAGFTIAELLIAATITVMIVVMLGSMFGSLTSTASRANQRTDAFREARAALQMIERDLTGLVRASQTAYFALDKRWSSGSDPYSDPAKRDQNRQVFALIAARNQAPSVAANSLGDVCAVGYYCQWAEPSPGTPGGSYQLRRFFRNSVDVYNAIRPSASTAGLTYVPPANLYAPDPARDDLLANHVWDLRIIPYKIDGTVDNTHPLVIDPSAPNILLPAAIEISFKAMSPAAGRTAQSAGLTPADWMELINPSEKSMRLIFKNAYSFRTRIDFQ